ncbi:MAG TPA: AAA family ATPase, partial [Solirubrobacteraceae bacterium]|nr:AAA family ATPase [Solirubrobacteraceae bacterium]
MHLRSISLKGFKSFPDRTRLEFTPGVSVVVGPNGSGKSNITDAVLWALGEQSPLAVRGQSMQDVIFAAVQHFLIRAAPEEPVVVEARRRRRMREPVAAVDEEGLREIGVPPVEQAGERGE